MREGESQALDEEVGKVCGELSSPVPICDQEWPPGTVPVVSVTCAAFMHERFIGKAIEGFLMQETTFPVEILIHDDASTDRTADIIRDYEAKYPALIRPIYQTENQFSLGNRPGMINRDRALGKFIASCEGDDYWTEPTKLQKQVIYLRANPSVAGCFHEIITVDENENVLPDYFADAGRYKGSYTQEDCLYMKSGYGTAGLMYRRSCLAQGYPQYLIEAPCDYLFDIVITESGTLDYLAFVGSAYRLHRGGIWQGIQPSEQQEEQLKRVEAMMSDPVIGVRYRRQLARLHALEMRYYHEALASEGRSMPGRARKCLVDRRGRWSARLFYRYGLLEMRFLAKRMLGRVR